MSEDICPLSDVHCARNFSCGEAALDRFIAERALDHQRSGYGKTWVVAASESSDILGFYTLCAAEISFETAPQRLTRGMPRYPVPCFLLARLAVRRENQGSGLGRRLVADAFRRCVASDIGAKCILVDAKNDRAAAFYQSLGFVPFPENPLRLFIKISTVERALRK